MFLVYCCSVHPRNGFLERVNPGKNCTIGFILFTLFFFSFFFLILFLKLFHRWIEDIYVFIKRFIRRRNEIFEYNIWITLYQIYEDINFNVEELLIFWFLTPKISYWNLIFINSRTLEPRSSRNNRSAIKLIRMSQRGRSLMKTHIGITRIVFK